MREARTSTRQLHAGFQELAVLPTQGWVTQAALSLVWEAGQRCEEAMPCHRINPGLCLIDLSSSPGSGLRVESAFDISEL